jgi:hypothetical protein
MKEKVEMYAIKCVAYEIQYHHNQVGYSERRWQRQPENLPFDSA